VEIFKARNPLCAICAQEGHDHSGGQVDHIKPHRGNYDLFWDVKNWQNLCAHHHAVKTSKELNVRRG